MGRLDVLAEAFAEGEISRAQLRAATKKANLSLDAVRQLLAGRASTPAIGDLVAAPDREAAWMDMPLDRQRAVVGTLVTVKLRPAGRGARTFDPTTVRVTLKGQTE